MARGKCSRYSGIGGQAVLEGVMMKNRESYAVAVRKPNGEIALEQDSYQGVFPGGKVKEIPLLRGIFVFMDSLILGMKCLNLSAAFYAEEGEKHEESGAQKAMGALVMVFSVLLALGIFVALPYFLASLFQSYVRNASLMAIIEGALRIAIFLLYICGISLMKDIRRLYGYHGAEHKCINCIERGRPLTVYNVMRSSRQHRRCGTSFLFFVVLVSIVLFFFIRVENSVWRVLLRILLMPAVAGISYEIIRLAGRSDNILVRILSAPGMWIQRMTTREPDRGMVETAIAAVEAVFDWKAYLRENFGYREETEAEETSEEVLSEAAFETEELESDV